MHKNSRTSYSSLIRKARGAWMFCLLNDKMNETDTDRMERFHILTDDKIRHDIRKILEGKESLKIQKHHQNCSKMFLWIFNGVITQRYWSSWCPKSSRCFFSYVFNLICIFLTTVMWLLTLIFISEKLSYMIESVKYSNVFSYKNKNYL